MCHPYIRHLHQYLGNRNTQIIGLVCISAWNMISSYSRPLWPTICGHQNNISGHYSTHMWFCSLQNNVQCESRQDMCVYCVSDNCALRLCVFVQPAWYQVNGMFLVSVMWNKKQRSRTEQDERWNITEAQQMSWCMAMGERSVHGLHTLGLMRYRRGGLWLKSTDRSDTFLHSVTPSKTWPWYVSCFLLTRCKVTISVQKLTE